MNCKPGDLAYTVPPHAEPGAVVKVERRATAADAMRMGYGWSDDTGIVIWYLTGRLKSWRGRTEGMAGDMCLRPITPPAGTVTDEEVRDLFAPKHDEVTS